MNKIIDDFIVDRKDSYDMLELDHLAVAIADLIAEKDAEINELKENKREEKFSILNTRKPHVHIWKDEKKEFLRERIINLGYLMGTIKIKYYAIHQKCVYCDAGRIEEVGE
jgi:hypothetical protein